METDKKGGKKEEVDLLSESIFFSNLYSFEVKTWSKTLQTLQTVKRSLSLENMSAVGNSLKAAFA